MIIITIMSISITVWLIVSKKNPAGHMSESGDQDPCVQGGGQAEGGRNRRAEVRPYPPPGWIYRLDV